MQHYKGMLQCTIYSHKTIPFILAYTPPIASALHFLLFSTLVLCISLTTNAQTSFRPKALILPISKDSSTNQYITHINQRTPFVSIKLVVDLGGKFLWVDCDQGYISSTYTAPHCGSSQCSLAAANTACTTSCDNPSPRPGCTPNACGTSPYNHYIRTSTFGEVGQDVVSLQSTNGSTPGPNVTVPRFLFTCGSTFLLRSLANGVTGMAGLGRTRIALPTQLASAFSFNRKFAICLTSSTTSNGAIFFGSGPYNMRPNVDISSSLTYTPLITNPVSLISAPSGEASAEYFIGVKSIRINQKTVSLNATLLSIDNNGFGGTTISTVEPFTVMHRSIYNSFTQVFVREATSMGLTRVASVAPFGVCFSSKNVSSTRTGPSVPTIDLVLQNKNVFWTIYGANSMVKVNDNVLCLGVVENGSEFTRPSIFVGAHQLEDNLLQFDLASSRVGFSSSLLKRQTTCSNFNFESKA